VHIDVTSPIDCFVYQSINRRDRGEVLPVLEILAVSFSVQSFNVSTPQPLNFAGHMAVMP